MWQWNHAPFQTYFFLTFSRNSRISKTVNHWSECFGVYFGPHSSFPHSPIRFCQWTFSDSCQNSSVSFHPLSCPRPLQETFQGLIFFHEWVKSGYNTKQNIPKAKIYSKLTRVWLYFPLSYGSTLLWKGSPTKVEGFIEMIYRYRVTTLLSHCKYHI